jgi:hypothetical protein
MMTERDLELLSAYLDGALNSEDRAALEARLETDATLRDELEGLRATVELLRGLPTLPAPRNFTLTPEQARRERGARVTGYIVHSAAFRVLSAAAIALIVFGAAILALNSNPTAPTALQYAPGVAALPTSTLVSPAPTQQPQPTMSPSVLPPLGEGRVAASPQIQPTSLPPADTFQDSADLLSEAAQSEAAGAAAPSFDASEAATPMTEAFAMEPETFDVQRTFEEAEAIAAGPMNAIPLTEQPDSLPTFALPTASPLPTLAPPTQTPPPTATITPTLVPAAPPTPISTPDIGVLLIAGGVLLLAVGLGLALLRGRVRG